MARNRYAYLNDFVADETGKYVYTGATYTLETGGRSRFMVTGVPAILSVAAAALAVLGGCIPAPQMLGHPATVLSYGAALIGSFLTVFSGVRVAFLKEPVRAYSYRETMDRYTPHAWIAAIGFGLSVLFYGYRMIRYGAGSPAWASWVFLLTEAAGCAISVWIARTTHRMVWTEHPGRKKKEEEGEETLPDPDDYRVV